MYSKINFWQKYLKQYYWYVNWSQLLRTVRKESQFFACYNIYGFSYNLWYSMVTKIKLNIGKNNVHNIKDYVKKLTTAFHRLCWILWAVIFFWLVPHWVSWEWMNSLFPWDLGIFLALNSMSRQPKTSGLNNSNQLLIPVVQFLQTTPYTSNSWHYHILVSYDIYFIVQAY